MKILIIILSIVVVGFALYSYEYALSVNGGLVEGAVEYATKVTIYLAIAFFFCSYAITILVRHIVAFRKGNRNALWELFGMDMDPEEEETDGDNDGLR